MTGLLKEHRDLINQYEAALTALIGKQVRLVVIIGKEHKQMLEAALAACAEEANIASKDILSGSRFRNVSDVRCVVAYIMREYTSLSLAQIGSLMNRDHSTIIHNVQKYEDLVFTDKDFAQLAHKIITNFSKRTQQYD
jgi:chromosomal replication initiation ATPase DnaA